MSWFDAWYASQNVAYYWMTYQIVFVLAVAAFAKMNNQD